MQAIITPPEMRGASASKTLHSFVYALTDGRATSTSEMTYAEAKAFIETRQEENAFVVMLQTIGAARPSQYSDLIGQAFED